MIDPIAATIALLSADAELAALVAGRIYGAPPGMPDDTPSPPPKSIVLQAAGGATGAHYPVIMPQLYVRCYGEDGEQSYRVFRALYGIFYDASGMARGPRRVDGRWLLRSATLSQGTGDLEPEGWPVTFCTLGARWDALQGA